MMKGLSKSRYTLFCQCPKALWLNIYKPEEAEVDKSLEARLRAGNAVGDLAMRLFGDYTEVTTYKEDGTLDLGAMINKTTEEMERGTENICEASFSFEGNYCAVDILRKTPDGWAIYEVKSASFSMSSENTVKLEKYAPDIAYQKWVLEKCGVKVTGTFLVCLDSDYVRDGDLDIQQLFMTKDMEELVGNEYSKVAARVKQALEVLGKEAEPQRDLSECCNKPYRCAFWTYCAKKHEVPNPSVFNLYGMPFSKKMAYYHEGFRTLESLNEKLELNSIQRMQIDSEQTGKAHINTSGIKEFLDKLFYPLYFLDFETMQDAIPQYDGARPYQQIPFQYSLHIKQNENQAYEHREFLAPSDGSDPRRLLAEQLCRDIPMNVCTVAYNKSFECTRIRELASLYPELSEHLNNIANRIVDLIDPFRAGDYYVKAMNGSFSIKSVLPALFPDDPELNYHNLDTRVQNGGDAMNIFPRIRYMAPEEAQASREALLRYCELDTWAMVKVWEKLKVSP